MAICLYCCAPPPPLLNQQSQSWRKTTHHPSYIPSPSLFLHPYFPPSTSPPLHQSSPTRPSCRPARRTSCLGISSVVGDSSFPDEPIIELPCLPFNPSEVFIPSATKTLYLYEARFLSLLEEAIKKYNNLFAHIVIEPVSDEVAKGEVSFSAKYGCLVRVERVKRLEIGALITIRGIGRVNLIRFTQLEPFLKGVLIPVQDETNGQTEDVDSVVEDLKVVLADVQRLQIKLKTSKDELLQTPLESALQWAEKGQVEDFLKAFTPCRAELISFAALQPVTGASAGELQKLLQERLHAMEATNTLRRLQNVNQHAQQIRASIAAKVALQSLEH